MSNSILIFGHGYTAAALSKCLIPKGWQVFGTVRNDENAGAAAAALKLQQVTPVLWESDALAAVLAGVSHVLVSTAPNAEGDPVLYDFGSLFGTAPNVKWLGYLSTTAVYGDHGGGWVDEDTPLSPTTNRGKLRVQAEKDWTGLAEKYQLPLHVFRLAGIYGPGRGPFAKVQAGTARRIIKKNQVFSRIHVDDIVQVLQASFAKPRGGAVYNLCDDDAPPPQDVIGFAAELLNRPIPEAIDFEVAEMTPMARSFYADSKKVRNDLIKTELGIVLHYPDYRVGLKALMAQD